MEHFFSSEVTALLMAWGNGNASARDLLIPLVYDDLKRIASRHLRREANPNGLQTTALVHETYLRLVQVSAPSLACRGEFYGMVARLIRQILVDNYRARKTEKRGNGAVFITFEKAEAVAGSNPVDLLVLEDLLDRLGERAPRQREIVEMRVFCGLSNEEIAEAFQISTRTVIRDWTFASAWLKRELVRGDPAV